MVDNAPIQDKSTSQTTFNSNQAEAKGKGQMAMTTKKRTLKTELANPIDLEAYLRYKGQQHNHFKYYSSLEAIDSVIQKRYIYLTRGDNWNDLEDRIPFSSTMDGFVRFGMCFSFSASESVAMWMLYGGITGNGAMVDLTRGDISSIRAMKSFELGYRTNDYGFETVCTIDTGFKCYAMDILYCGKNDDDTYSVKRSDERIDGLRSIPKAKSILRKSYPWSYENEVRLIVEVPQNKINGNVSCIRIPLPRSSKEMKRRAFLAPNNSIEGMGYNRSALKGRIDWNLCRECGYRNT